MRPRQRGEISVLRLESNEKESQDTVGFVYSKNLPAVFRQLRITLAVTTYQAQRVALFSAPSEEKISLFVRELPRPTGIAFCGSELAIASRNYVVVYRVTPTHDASIGNFDSLIVPSRIHFTGDMAAHQLAWHHSSLYVVATRFSCLGRIDNQWSFTPTWKPDFISSIVSEDRCHLNGVAFSASGPQLATALGTTDEREGWRSSKATGGVLIDIPTNSIMARGLCMPHSPRLYREKLWFLDSGRGALCTFEPNKAAVRDVLVLPGYTRGLAFWGNYAFIGLSRIRDTNNFGDLPIGNSGTRLLCGIAVCDLDRAELLGHLEFNKGIEELFDIEILPSLTNPYLASLDDELLNKIFHLPTLPQ